DCDRGGEARRDRATVPARGGVCSMTAFADALALRDGRVTLVELVPWAGPLQHDDAGRPLDLARALAADPRVTAVTITDNAGGHVRLGPLTLGRAIQEMGGVRVVHLFCRQPSPAV